MGFLEEMDLTNAPTIPEYYKGKTIFITGGSGFVGKVLIEKLLYSCTDLDRIYLLMRGKRGVPSEQRLDQLYSTPCFDRLRAEKPKIFKEKVLVLAGDITEPGLGLSDEDTALIINRVNIVFHVAASVRFNDTLSYAVEMNLCGAQEMVDLAKDMTQLSSYVHVSTSYANTNHSVVREAVYPPLAPCEDTVRVCRAVDSHTLHVLTDKYLNTLPNTYTFTKQLAEHVVYERRGQLPAVIVRPSIVIASVSEPLPGWLENFNGPVGIFVACGKGIMRSIHTKLDIVSDFIAVDVCVRHMIAAAWVRGIKQLEQTDDIEVYNCCSGELQMLTMAEVTEMCSRIGEMVPLDNALWSIGGNIITSNETLHYWKVILWHLLPAVFIDMILWLIGKKPMLVKIQRRIYTANQALKYYMTQQWTFDNTNFVTLRSTIKPEDKDQFYYDIENNDVEEYFKTCIYAARRYLLKEKDEDVPKARAHVKRMKLLDRIVRMMFYGCIIYWLGNIINRKYNGILYDSFFT